MAAIIIIPARLRPKLWYWRLMGKTPYSPVHYDPLAFSGLETDKQSLG